jgi:hypothetical protein
MASPCHGCRNRLRFDVADRDGDLRPAFEGLAMGILSTGPHRRDCRTCLLLVTRSIEQRAVKAIWFNDPQYNKISQAMARPRRRVMTSANGTWLTLCAVRLASAMGGAADIHNNKGRYFFSGGMTIWVWVTSAQSLPSPRVMRVCQTMVVRPLCSGVHSA